MFLFLLFLLVFLCSWALTGLARYYAIANLLIDVPNQRSSHVTPTPRGGGISIAVIIISAVAILALYIPQLKNEAFAICGGGFIIAAIGWLDDHYSLSPKIRLLFQMAAILWALYWLGGLPSISLNSVVIPLGGFGFIFAAAAILWLTNLYNFMDGSDGLAATEGIFVSLASGILLYMHEANELALISLSMAAACGGFLIWNWPPAKIFMGDVGSTFVGFIFGILTIASENSGKLPAAIWFILLALFVGDATCTLISRIWKGEVWYQPHRSHMYQRLIAKRHSHQYVIFMFLALNLCVLLPLALLAFHYSWLTLWLVSIVMVGSWLLWTIIQHEKIN